MLSPHVSQAKAGHAALDPSKRPGLERALVICKHTKFREQLVTALHGQYEVDYYASPTAAMSGLRAQKTPVLVVMDYDQVVFGSRDFMRLKMERPHLSDIPILVTGRVPKEKFKETVRMLCPVQYLRRPFMKSNLQEEAGKLSNRMLEASWGRLPQRRHNALVNSLSNFRGITRRVRRGHPLNMHDTKESCQPLLEEVLDGDVGELLECVKEHHNHTYVHSVKVATLMALMAHAIGIRGQDLLTVAAGGLLMDIGKVAVSQDLLNSPEPLTQEQLEDLKKHVLHSKNILDHSDSVTEAVRVLAEQHHEKLDGSGYPKGLTGRDLNELARLATIVDIFCALTDKRSYKPAYTCESSLKVLEKMEGKLDPFLLALFKEIVMDVYAPGRDTVH